MNSTVTWPPLEMGPCMFFAQFQAPSWTTFNIENLAGLHLFYLIIQSFTHKSTTFSFKSRPFSTFYMKKSPVLLSRGFPSYHQGQCFAFGKTSTSDAAWLRGALRREDRFGPNQFFQYVPNGTGNMLFLDSVDGQFIWFWDSYHMFFGML